VDDVAALWREKLLTTMQPYIDLPIMLSGGVDSGTLLCAALELGGRPPCYSFKLTGPDIPDVQVARKMANDFDLPFTLIVIPRNEEQLLNDIREVISLLGVSKKASVQCSQPVMYMCRQMKADGFDRAIVGTGAVCLDDKKVAMLWAKEGEESARAYRAAKLNDKNTNCGTGNMHRMGRICGVPLVEPYSEEPLVSHALALDYAELNRPKQKGIALRAFPDFWKRGYYRRNSPLQVNSGVREWHDTLLKSPVNNGHQAVVAIYNEIRKELEAKGELAEPL